ncbi:MAG: hypothetical protein FWF94_01135 [Oscillospiraceae bacterium]|nr:hypothetical protein [Oscillospiraceae bacterium]
MISAVVFLLFYIAVLASIALISSGLLAIPVAIAVITGLFTNVASDLSPLSMLLTGISCISAGLAMALGIIILFPKQPKIWLKR